MQIFIISKDIDAESPIIIFLRDNLTVYIIQSVPKKYYNRTFGINKIQNYESSKYVNMV